MYSFCSETEQLNAHNCQTEESKKAVSNCADDIGTIRL